MMTLFSFFFFFFNDTATTEIYTLSLHDALPISSTGDEALFQCTKPSGVLRGPSHLQFPWLLRATMRSPLRSPAQVEGTQGFLPQPEKDLERPSSTRLEARFP